MGDGDRSSVVLQCDVDAHQPLILIVGSAHHTSIAMSMRLQTDQQTIAIVSLDYHRILGLLLQLSLPSISYLLVVAHARAIILTLYIRG